jgi:hypothetical protein
MRRLMSTAKTTLLPANHSLGTKKGLHSNERLDDNQDPKPALDGLYHPRDIDHLLSLPEPDGIDDPPFGTRTGAKPEAVSEVRVLPVFHLRAGPS